MNWINKTGFLMMVIFCSCNSGNKTMKQSAASLEKKALDYAKEFSIEQNDEVKQLTIYTSADDRDHKETYNLVYDAALKLKYANSIKVPCKKIICLSSTQLSYFFELDDIDNIAAINSSRYLKHKGMHQKVKEGAVKKIGKEGSFNLEVIAAINPDVIFVSPFKAGGFDALRNMGIPLVPVAAYNEKTPLGRAEWIKMISLFIDKEQKADSIFNKIESNYAHLKSLTDTVKYRPTVFSGKMRSGSWYVPGGESFYAHYFKDAGADYIIKDNHQGAYPLDFETMYKKAFDCDYWRIINPEKDGFSLTDLAEQDSRYKDFKAFQNGNVLFCNIRQKPYYEQAAVKPDVLLADYIHFFHPDLLPEYSPEFYEKLNDK
ncbi:ABC transporter substrate-binding protein [Plebeiibacterium sediminum]|uniref:ABC transporter substrate-binding protein n=1 Tax=Plebeiibacterium sediminum TaxID=2992112 RepID=A0AAE3SF60_9BACT|nr:ABC transporter substrate-binding protein [Plebeiobacterium sediminum]MCW3787125.1 ABC transporter substrate-binding protein [Plebeiobacterium sediminum]